MHDRPFRAIIPVRPAPHSPARHGVRKPPGLNVRFVVRMSDGLSAAIGQAARSEGLTAGAWARRLLLDRLKMQSDADARSGRPVPMPEAYQVAIAAALGELAVASAATQAADPAAAAAAIQAARALMVGLVLGRKSP